MQGMYRKSSHGILYYKKKLNREILMYETYVMKSRSVRVKRLFYFTNTKNFMY